MLKQVGAGAAITAALFLGGWLYGQHQYRAGYEMAHKEQAAALAQAHEKAREIERKMQSDMEVIRHDATLQIMEVAADASAASDTADRLRTELARYRSNATNACATAGSPSASDPIGMLIGVLEGLESTGREIAEYADRARVAGLACERAYDSVRMIN